MKNIFFVFIFAELISMPALAGMDIPINSVTAYAGGDGKQSCKYDKMGGGPSGLTSKGDMAIYHTVDGRRDGGYAVAAVPQVGGNAGIFGCQFRDEQNYPGVLFHANDHYAVKSNGKLKYDASHACTERVKSDSKPATFIVVEGSCGGVKGGQGDKIPRHRRHARRSRHRYHRT